MNFASIANPEWDKAGKCHDWRNYIGEMTRRIWVSFSDAQKLALALDADEKASDEDWI